MHPDVIQYNQKEKEKEINKMKQVNLWRSIYTGHVIETPIDFLPKFDGWELIGTITKE